VSNVKAALLMRERLVLSTRAFVEIVIWRLPQPSSGSTHPFKYRLAYVVDEVAVVRFDNEAGKGDHKHLNESEVPYEFADLDRLQEDFWTEVNARRKGP
jgi:hypothetical protein